MITELDLKNPALKRAVKAVLTSGVSDDTVIGVMKEIIPATMYIPMKMKHEVEFNYRVGDSSINDKSFTSFPSFSKDNKKYVPVFTDGEEYRKFMDNGYDDYRACKIDYVTLAAMINSMKDFDGFLLDPYGSRLSFTRGIVEEINKHVEVS